MMPFTEYRSSKADQIICKCSLLKASFHPHINNTFRTHLLDTDYLQHIVQDFKGIERQIGQHLALRILQCNSEDGYVSNKL